MTLFIMALPFGSVTNGTFTLINTRNKYGAVTSTDLVNWKDISDKVSFPDGTRHGMILKITKDEFNKLIGQ
jgi:hypothetical protein